MAKRRNYSTEFKAKVAPAPDTSRRHPRHAVYPYLLRGLDIAQPNQVWCADVTFIPMAHGFLYLLVVMDWYSRRVLSWWLSNGIKISMDGKGRWMDNCNHERPHSSLKNQTPNEVYEGVEPLSLAA